jgi:AcrR family transcriptional regulator
MSTRKRRVYRSESRRRQAEETKRRILGGQRGSFHSMKLIELPIEEIATEAKVASPTIFGLFQSKRGLLSAFVDENLFGKRDETLVEQTKVAHPLERLRRAASISWYVYDAERSEMVFSEARPPSLRA